AASNPPIHHDFAPTTWDLFWRYVLGSDFRGSMGFLSPDGPGNALGALPAFIRSLDAGSHPAIAMAVIGLALVGLIALARSSPRAWWCAVGRAASRCGMSGSWRASARTWRCSTASTRSLGKWTGGSARGARSM